MDSRRVERVIPEIRPEGVEWIEVGSGRGGAPAFGTGWSNGGSSTEQLCAFFKDQFGWVHFKGLAYGNGGGVTNLIFTLPEGFAPKGTQAISFPTGYWTGAAWAIGRILVHSAQHATAPRQVQARNNADGFASSTDWQLSHISFRL